MFVSRDVSVLRRLWCAGAERHHFFGQDLAQLGDYAAGGDETLLEGNHDVAGLLQRRLAVINHDLQLRSRYVSTHSIQGSVVCDEAT